MSRHLPGRRTRGPVHASRRSPFPSRPAARLLAVALAGAALAACADERTPDPTEPAAARSAHSGAPIATSVPVVRIFFVNPTTGNDANDGTTAKPFKTLTKALAIADAQDTVHLAAGGYGPFFSGDPFPAAGTAVRTGVTILGAKSASGAPTAVISAPLGNAAGLGLRFLGDATVRDVSAGGFPVVLFAKQGTQRLTNVTVAPRRTGNAVIDGVAERGGLVLRGSAQAKLTNGTVDLTQSPFDAGSATGVDVAKRARFTMTGGSIKGTASVCDGSTGVQLRDTTQATLTDPTVINVAGSALVMKGVSKATLLRASIERTPPSGCAPAASVRLEDSTALTLRSSVVITHGGKSAVGISSFSDAPLVLDTTAVIGYTRAGLLATGHLRLDVRPATTFQSNATGIDAEGATTTSAADLRITGASLFNDIDVIAPVIKMRKTVVGGVTGILFPGFQVTGTQADLGTAADPGGNTIQVANTGVGFLNATNDIRFIQASGNTWHAGVQGADAAGHYKVGKQISGITSLAIGRNFSMSTPNSVIQF